MLPRMVPPKTEVVSVRSTDWWQAIQARRTARIQRNEGGYSSSLVTGLLKTKRSGLWSKLSIRKNCRSVGLSPGY